MLSMLSQMSSSQAGIEPFQYAAPQPGMLTRAAMVGAAILFALIVVNSVSGLTQAFGIA